jgi:hypothetical protein
MRARRDNVDAQVAYWNEWRWVHWFTLDFCRYIGEERAVCLFNEWIDAMEWTLGRRIGWLRCHETVKRTLDGFASVPLHFHGFLLGTENLSLRFGTQVWKAMAGTAVIERFDPDGNALRYALKTRDFDLAETYQSNGEYDCRNLEYFTHRSNRLESRVQRSTGSRNARRQSVRA